MENSKDSWDQVRKQTGCMWAEKSAWKQPVASRGAGSSSGRSILRWERDILDGLTLESSLRQVPFIGLSLEELIFSWKYQSHCVLSVLMHFIPASSNKIVCGNFISIRGDLWRARVCVSLLAIAPVTPASKLVLDTLHYWASRWTRYQLLSHESRIVSYSQLVWARHQLVGWRRDTIDRRAHFDGARCQEEVCG